MMNTRKITSLLKLTGITASVVLVAESCTQAWYTKGVEAWLLQDKNEFAIADSEGLKDAIDAIKTNKKDKGKSEEFKLTPDIVEDELLHKVAVTKFPNLTLDNEKVPAGHRFFWEPKLDKEATVTDAVAGDSFVTVATTSKLVKDKDTDKDATVYKFNLEKDFEIGENKKVKIRAVRIPVTIQVGLYKEEKENKNTKIVRDISGTKLESEYIFATDQFIKSDKLNDQSPFEVVQELSDVTKYFEKTYKFDKDTQDNTLPSDGDGLNEKKVDKDFRKILEGDSVKKKDTEYKALMKRISDYNKVDEGQFKINAEWRKEYTENDIYSVYSASSAKQIIFATLKYDMRIGLKDEFMSKDGDYKAKAYALSHTNLVSMLAQRKAS